MRFTVTDDSPSDLGEKFIYGFLWMAFADIMWFIMITRVFKSELYNLIHTRDGGKAVYVGSYFFYWTVASLFGGFFESDVNTQTNAKAGALVGFTVFFVHNIIALALNKDYQPRILPIDTAFGTIAWMCLFLIQQSV